MRATKENKTQRLPVWEAGLVRPAYERRIYLRYNCNGVAVPLSIRWFDNEPEWARKLIENLQQINIDRRLKRCNPDLAEETQLYSGYALNATQEWLSLLGSGDTTIRHIPSSCPCVGRTSRSELGSGPSTRRWVTASPREWSASTGDLVWQARSEYIKRVVGGSGAQNEPDARTGQYAMPAAAGGRRGPMR